MYEVKQIEFTYDHSEIAMNLFFIPSASLMFSGWIRNFRKLPVLSIQQACTLDTFQDFLITEHMKPHMHILEISISSLNYVVVRPTKTPKSANKKCQFLTFKGTFLC